MPSHRSQKPQHIFLSEQIQSQHCMKSSRHIISFWYCYDIECSGIPAYSTKVRGTPGSGKTVLTRLLAAHIKQQDPTVDNVLRIFSWPPVEGRSYSYDVVLKQKGWVEHEKTVFIFDEGQLTYTDEGLWNDFFKSVHESRGLRRVIVFASYGSPTSRIIIKGNTPMDLPDHQRVTLRHVDHGDGLRPAGLLFTQSEFNDLIDSHYRSPNSDF